MDLKVRINKYQADESLIIYRNNWEFVNEGLLPKFEVVLYYSVCELWRCQLNFLKAQALHPLPYPDSKNPEPDWKLQIYNAWWNGVILGYPEYFVDCKHITLNNVIFYYIILPINLHCLPIVQLTYSCFPFQHTVKLSTTVWTRMNACCKCKRQSRRFSVIWRVLIRPSHG